MPGDSQPARWNDAGRAAAPDAPSPAASWHRRVAARLLTQLPLKAVGIPGFIALFFVGYFYLLRHPMFPVSIMPLIEFDRWVPFEPRALWLYVSLWVYVSLPPLLLASRRELYAYGTHAAGLCLLGMACFLFWPTAVPPADLIDSGEAGLSMLKGVDAAGNACPSLHVATAVFSALFLDRQLRELASPRAAAALNWLWCIGIVYSTMATRQHVALDVLGGLALGLAVGAASLAAFRRLPAIPAFAGGR